MLRRLVQRLDPAFFRPFVHIDRRSEIGAAQISELHALGCDVSKAYPIRWGSFTHLEAILSLMRRALSAGGFDYVHIISGQDYPLKTAEEFERQCDGR
ncbi:MAG: beta-1,6-N-acetylglucosaminyltransferase, partial [Sphingomicrobium sp.]